MNKNVNKKVLYVLPLLLWSACQAQSPQATQAPAETNPDHSPANSASQNSTTAIRQTHTRTYPALQKHPASGQIQLKANQLVLRLELYPEANETPEDKTNPQADFQTQLLNLSTVTQLQATVTDSHGKTYQPNGADGNGAVNYSGGTITLTFDNLVPDELLLVEVQAKNGTTDIVQADLAAVLKHTTAASTPNSTINFQTTVAAKAMKALIANDADRARSIDLNALNTLTTAITGVSGSAPNFSYPQKHPALVNTALLASDLQAQNPGDLSAANYRNLQGATINLNVTGLNGGDKLQVQINDAASAVQTHLGNGTTVVTGVATGGPIGVSVSAFGTPTQNYSYTVGPATFTPTEGNPLNLTVTATPALNVSGFSPGSGPAGTSVTLNGTGFTGATAVTFGGASASFTVDSDTQITATVPANAVEGVIRVTNGGTESSANSFDVHRRIYVNDDATGSNTGTSWTNAYTSLQTALAAAGANDEIWIAEGTYTPVVPAGATPTSAERDVSFVMKENVNMYGGFAGTESALGDRTASLTDFVTVLSGDLNNNDNYSTTPPTNITDNSETVVIAHNATLEGVTIRGGNRINTFLRVAGLYNSGKNLVLTDVNFDHNTGSNNFAVGGMRNLGNAQSTLNNVSFTNNYATGFVSVGAIQNLYNNSSVVLNNATFDNNRGDASGAIDNSYDNASVTLTNATFSNNSGSAGSAITNDDDNATTTLTNVTFSENSGQGISNSSQMVLQNVLLWKTSVSGVSLSGNGNVVVPNANDPFVNSSNPNGADGIPRTADDGLRIAPAATAVINQGVTGPEVPATDILGNARISNPEPGAYEYITPPLPANVLVVKGNATGNNDGSSWANAFTDLQSALAAANGTTTTEIWIAEGQYTPAPSNGDRNLSFVMKDNVSLYGGFVGTETQRTERDPLTHTVTLSGDLNGNDNYSVQPFGNIAENSYTVIRGANNAVLDGVAIEGGNSDAAVVVADAPDIVGGGMINDGTSPTLNQVIFTHNSAVSRGGAMFNVNLSNPMMTHMRFIQNVSDGQGGALFNLDASPQITVGAFIGNTAASGGGMYTRTISGIVGNANAVLKNVIFSGNTATNRGGGMYSGNYATPELINVTFSNNTATNDAGAFYDVTSSTTTSLKNVLFWNSTRRSSPVIPLDPSAGNVDAASNPFVNGSDIAGPDGQYFTADDGLRLTASASDVLNMGTNIDIPSTDIIGNARPGSSNTNAEPGAYEYTP